MFPNLKLESVYFSHTENIAERFFVPVLKEAVQFNRVSAYFSAKALALYAEGLEYFGRENHCYRLIISKDVSEEDYRQIKAGYNLKESLTGEMIQELRQNLSLKEEKNISNLAYLISAGVVDIKIAFKTTGIFHDKCGVVTDGEGNKICFRGSNNETVAAALNNYEAFNVTCSWLDCDGFYLTGINNCEKEFFALWNNEKEGITVLPAQDVVLKEILSHNKGRLIVEEALLQKDAVILDYEGGLKLIFNTESTEWFFNNTLYKFRLKNKSSDFSNNILYFKTELTYLDYKKIDGLLRDKIPSLGYAYYATKRLLAFIEEKNIHIEERRNLGLELKSGSNRFNKEFAEFERILVQNMSRSLRPKQLRDAFFMLAMQKAGNFSVPGSGKTTSVLAVYCYLKHKDLVEKILVVGPKNCFKSWKDEFNVCFHGKEALNEFDVQTCSLPGSIKKKNYLKYNSSVHNLLLFNYDCLSTYEEILSEIVTHRTLLVFDEVHRVKRVNGEHASHALNVAKNANYTIAMTGTPIPNSYRDLYNFLHILFPNEYNSFFNFSVAKLSSPSPLDMETVNSSIQPFFCRTTKQQLAVPLANDDVLNACEVSANEQKVFEILCKKYRQNKLALLVRILQLESNPKMILQKLDLREFSEILDITDNIDDIDFVDYSEEIKSCINSIGLSSKKRTCIDKVNVLVQEGKPVIVWCIFQNSIESITEELDNIGVSSKSIYGVTNAEDRECILESFKKGDFQVLITNPHTLAESVSLHSICHDAIYFEYSYNLVHLLQSKDRIHRLGLPDGQYTQYHFMQSWYKKGGEDFSLDNAIYLRLNEKEQIMLKAIDNNVLESVTTPEEDVEIIFKDLF